MPVEINELNATTRLGAPSGESRIPEADVERIARRGIEILAQRERMTKMARPDNPARSTLALSSRALPCTTPACIQTLDTDADLPAVRSQQEAEGPITPMIQSLNTNITHTQRHDQT